MKTLLTAIVIFCIMGIAHARPNVLDIESKIKTDAAVETIWDVLTDYNNYDQFISMITTSTYRADRFTGKMHILQEIKLNIFFLKKTVKLRLYDLEEKAFHSIHFRGNTFYTTKPSWIENGSLIISEDKTVTIKFQFLIRPIFLVPKAVVRNAVNKRIDQAMQEVKIEIDRREKRLQNVTNNYNGGKR